MPTEILTKNLDVVFLVYGAAFFIAGIAILMQPRENSVFRLSEIIWIFAGFALIHGLNEWLDMIAIIKGYGPKAWAFTRLTVLTVSFIFLFEYGRRLIRLSFDKLLNKWITAGVSVVVVALIFISKEEQGIWPRYLLAFPGGAMTAIGFVLYYRRNESILKLFNIRAYFVIVAAAMGAYCIFGGIIVPQANFFPASAINNASFLKAFGVPVQVFRAICAIFLAWGTWNILSVFDRELKANLMNKTAEALAAKDYAERIIDAMTCALTVVGPDGRIKVVNAAACELLGYKDKELIGKPAPEIFAEKPPLDNRKLKDSPLTYLSKDKVKIPVLFSRSFTSDQKGELKDTVCVGKDIREIKELQEKVIASEKLAAMGKVASIIGHEFRNQLGIIGISAYFLKTKLQDGDEKVKRHLAILEHQVAETNRIIENILAYSRSGELERKSVDVGNVLLAAVDKTPNPNKISIVTKIESGLPQVEGDEIRLGQVFINLITNALQAIGEKEGRLTIRADRAGSFLEVLFEDTGAGIREEDKGKLFTPFFSTKPHGIGLGLGLCKNIVEMHNGAIDIKGELGKGTIVTVRLPTKG